MNLTGRLRSTVKAARKRGAAWVRLVDFGRLLLSGAGRGELWTRIAHGGVLHQTSPQTSDDRYPELFDLAARIQPSAGRILSFGCSTGEELAALHRRFPSAEIVGVEINPRSRRTAARRFRGDSNVMVIDPSRIGGSFDIIFALAVLQREPHKVAETELENLSRHYPFERFDAAVRDLAARLRSGGLLVVTNAFYRVEDSSVARDFQPVAGSPAMDGLLFGPDSLRAPGATARTIFRKG